MKARILNIILLISLVSCSNAEELKIKKDYSLKVREPSGLTYDQSSDSFWTVSDESSTLYNISSKGKVLDKIEIDAYDLEGIAVSSDRDFYVVDEFYKELIILDSQGEEQKRVKLDIQSPENNGPEGICLNEGNSRIILVNEKNPGLLQIYDYQGNKEREFLLDFAPDYSGITYDKGRNAFWILSDEAKTLYLVNMEEGVQARYQLDIPDPEGIAVDKKGRLYIVSDSQDKLYQMEKID
ncbi:MAG: hypothetical protein B6241_04875 [Spirochaetaceae bacterium 4572_59]|nr:MAG: hypothetical protein B6241_04875 [Spirochaetaceae bacterium 4572_59]